MKRQLEQVNKFHQVFGQGEAPEIPQLLDEDNYTLRFKLMTEENLEYYEACANEDIVEIADALGDQLYILCGTLLKHGLQHKIEEVFDEIHRSNMSKLDEEGKPIIRLDGKIMKSSLYEKPNIEKILKK